jgi:hypothetical protein
MTVAVELVKALHDLVQLGYFWCACWIVISLAGLIVRVVKD